MLKLIMDILGVSKQTILQTLSQLTVQFMDSQSTIYTKHASKSFQWLTLRILGCIHLLHVNCSSLRALCDTPANISFSNINWPENETQWKRSTEAHIVLEIKANTRKSIRRDFIRKSIIVIFSFGYDLQYCSRNDETSSHG